MEACRWEWRGGEKGRKKEKGSRSVLFMIRREVSERRKR